MLTFLAFLIVFGVLVFVHELGHFLAARRIGVMVEEFGFGFPPHLWSRKKGDTLYSINAIPLGGFVKLYGEHGEKADDVRSFASKTKIQKVFVLVSGVLMNLFLAFWILFLLYLFGFKPTILGMKKYRGIKNDLRIEIIKVEENTPASESLKVGDIVKKIEGEDIYVDVELFMRLNEFTKNNPEKEVNLTIIREGREEIKKLKTYETEIEGRNGKIKARRVGVVLETKGSIRAPIYLAPFVAFLEIFRLGSNTFVGIVDFFKKIFTRLIISDNVIGPVGIVTMIGGVAKLGLEPLLQFVAILSASLAIINIMPIPALDGGHLLILFVEKIKRKDLSLEAKSVVQFLGFAFIIMIIIIITIRDLTGISVLEYIKNIF